MTDEAAVCFGIIIGIILGALISWMVTAGKYEFHMNSPAKAWAIYQEQVELAETKYREAFGK